MLKKLFCSVVSVLVLAGCTSDLMRKSEPVPTASSKVSADRARVVFMRTSMVAGAIGVEMIEIENGDMKFVGQLPTANKIVYETTPGEKVFMAYGAAADFMRAKLTAGKTYYVIVRPNWGTGGFAPTPVRADGTSGYHMQSADFKDWLSSTTQLETNEKAASWFQENKTRYQGIYQEYWSRWMRKTEDEKNQRTLRADDGV